MDAATENLDRISDLPDKVLHLILGFLPGATAAARTSVLSRRWRREWVQAPNLVLSDTRPKDDDNPYLRGRRHARRRRAQRRRTNPAARLASFPGFVDSVLAQRGDAGGTGVVSLQIDVSQYGHTSAEKVNEWLRHAMQLVTGSFLLRVTRESTAVELPSHGRATSIRLDLPHRSLQLPPATTASTYEALTELVLESARLGGGGRSLGDFVSSCCPRLRKLAIEHPIGLQELVLRAEALEELSLRFAADLRTLDVIAPNLRDFSVHGSFWRHEKGVSPQARVVAPRLQVIGMHQFSVCKHPDLDIHDPTSVRCLRDLRLDMQGRYYRNLSAGIWLLENCPGVEHVEVSLEHFPVPCIQGNPPILGEFIDLTVEGAPPFANVRSLVVDRTDFPDDFLLASISSLLLRCPRLRSLNLSRTWEGFRHKSKVFYDDWENHQKVSLLFLEEVEISGFTGVQEEMDLVNLLFESSVSINKVTITSAAKIRKASNLKRMLEQNQPIDEKLMNITGTNRGHWDFHHDDVYTWKSCVTTEYATKTAQADGGITNR